MKQERISVKVLPDIRRRLKDGRFPLKLRLTFKRQRKYYAIGQNVNIEEWEILNSEKAKGRIRSIKNEIAIIENKALKVSESISPFSFRAFELQFFEKTISDFSLEHLFARYINNLENNNQFGTASSYQNAINSLLQFKKNLKVFDVSVDFLKDYERSMLKNHKSITTVGIYLRSLRSVLNQAKSDGIIKDDQYPFGNRKYTIPAAKNIKKALSLSEIEKLFVYTSEAEGNIQMAKDFWIFSYLCNGINMMDIAYLRWQDVTAKTISFIRRKTKNATRANSQPIIALRNSFIDDIIKRHAAKKRNKEDYVFSIIEAKDDEKNARDKIKQFTKVVNKWTKKIGEELGFEIKLTTYVARHSFATILVQNGASLELASQSLGHTNLITTQKYFAGFDLESQSSYFNSLVDFKKTKDK